MQFKLSLFAFIALTSVVADQSTTSTETITVSGHPTYPTTTCTMTPTPEPSCPPRNHAIFLRRMWNGATMDHFYSTYGPEVAQFGTQGYVEEPPQGLVYPVQEAGTVPLFRCDDNTGTKVDHFYTADPAEFQAQVAAGCKVNPEPEIAQGIGYLYTAPFCNSVPLYRLFSASRVDHFYTINETERQMVTANGLYRDEGITGYVLPNQ